MKKLNKTTIVSLVMALIAFLVVVILLIVYKNQLGDRFHNTFKSSKQFTDLLKGLGNTLFVTFLAFIMGILIGTITCLVLNIKSDNIFVIALKNIFKVYVAIFRGTPMVVQLLIIYFIIFSTSRIEPLYVATISFGLNSGAYVSEIIRGGINSVENGQVEAGRSLGLSYFEVMTKIVLPQAIRNALPSLGNELITLVKETSIVSFIGAVDLTKAFQNSANIAYDSMLVYLLMGIVYFVIVLLLTKLLRLLERKLTKYARS